MSQREARRENGEMSAEKEKKVKYCLSQRTKSSLASYCRSVQPVGSSEPMQTGEHTVSLM